MDIYLTKFQIEKYNSTGELKLTKNVFKKPNVSLPLTKCQIEKLKRGEEVIIKTKKGGFIPLTPLIAGISGLISAGANVYNSYENKKANEKLVKQRIRQNDILEKQNKEGKPIFINTLEKDANKLLSNENNKTGNALFLKKIVLNTKNGGTLCNGKNNVSTKNLELEALIMSSKKHLFL